ncbi:cell wall-binding repeat protein, partial [Gemelliphila asaccharolytica]
EWEIIGGKWYYFDINGYMLVDTITPDGYYIDTDGACIN